METLQIGDIVTHKSLGQGEIKAVNEKYIVVKFEDRESKFLIPFAFEKGYLQLS